MPCEYRDTQSITMEAETEVLKLQAKKHLGLPEARRGKEEFSPSSSGRNMAPQRLAFRFLAFKTVRGYIYIVLSYPVCGASLRKPYKTNKPDFRNLVLYSRQTMVHRRHPAHCFFQICIWCFHEACELGTLFFSEELLKSIWVSRTLTWNKSEMLPPQKEFHSSH